MIIHDCIQKSDEWFELKKNNPFSASNAQAIGNQGAGLETLVNDALIALYFAPDEDKYTNEDMDRGNELEDEARATYEFETDSKVTEIGFITHKDYELAGVSPDGLVNDDGLAEIKCQKNGVFIKKLYELSKTGTFKIESQYEWQMQMQMLFTDRKWCDFVVYNKNAPKKLLVQRVTADLIKQEKIKIGLAIAVKMFREREVLLNKLK